MSLEKDMKDAAKDTIQSVTGTPPDQLRGLTVWQAFNDFIARQSATPIVATNSTPPPSIASQTTVFPSAPIPVNEQPLTPPSGVGDSSTPNKEVIIDDNGTLNFYNIVADFIGPV